MNRNIIRSPKAPWKRGNRTIFSPSLIEEPSKKRLGRKPNKPVKKPNLKIAVDLCGQSKMARYLKIFPSHISFWLYSDNKVPKVYANQISNLSLGLIQAKDINSECLKIRQKK